LIDLPGLVCSRDSRNRCEKFALFVGSTMRSLVDGVSWTADICSPTKLRDVESTGGNSARHSGIVKQRANCERLAAQKWSF